jgi:large subunit ribosomal protein L25
MKQVSLSGSARTSVGKKDAAQLRANGMVPCVVYGGKEQVQFAVKELDLRRIVYSPDVYQVNLDINGKSIPAIIQEKQFHPVTDAFLHIDFLEITHDKDIRVELPVRLTGAAPGVIMGGKLSTPFKKIQVEGLGKDIPEAITLNISNMNIGDMVRVKDLQMNGLKILAPAASVVVGVKMARGAKKEGEEAAK